MKFVVAGNVKMLKIDASLLKTIISLKVMELLIQN